MSYKPRTRPTSPKAVLNALQYAAARARDPMFDQLQGTTVKALLASAEGLTETLRNALGTLALAEVLGPKAAKQITTETTWYNHRDALQQIGIELALRKPPSAAGKSHR